jgi:hypothetical protein
MFVSLTIGCFVAWSTMEQLTCPIVLISIIPHTDRWALYLVTYFVSLLCFPGWQQGFAVFCCEQFFDAGVQEWINPKWDKYLWCMFQMKRVEKDIREALAQNEPVPDLVKWIEVCFCNPLCDSKLSWFLLDFVSNFIMVLDVAAFFLLQRCEVKRSSDKHVSFNGCSMLRGGFFFSKNCVWSSL